MFVCKICDEEYDENMRYSRDSRYCKKCGEERTQYLSYRRNTLASLRSMPLEAKIIQTKFLINQAVRTFGENTATYLIRVEKTLPCYLILLNNCTLTYYIYLQIPLMNILKP